jgi:hypothetical protein
VTDFLRPVEDTHFLIRRRRPTSALKWSLTVNSLESLIFPYISFLFSKMELESRNNSTDRIEPDELVHSHEGRQLPPVDGGKDAWMFLVAGFIIEGLTWGWY